VQKRVAAGRLKQPEKIGAAVERVLQRHHGCRYYAWELTDGQLRFFEHPVNLPREQKYEGKYLIQTDQPDMTAQDAVTHYKELNEVERGYSRPGRRIQRSVLRGTAKHHMASSQLSCSRARNLAWRPPFSPMAKLIHLPLKATTKLWESSRSLGIAYVQPASIQPGCILAGWSAMGEERVPASRTDPSEGFTTPF